jgi:DNA-binding XRE family transcriptional regulator
MIVLQAGKVSMAQARCNESGPATTRQRGFARHKGPVLSLSCHAKRHEASLAMRTKCHRLAAGLTQAESAKWVGLSVPTLRDSECNRSEPKWRNLAKLIRLLRNGLVAMGK